MADLIDEMSADRQRIGELLRKHMKRGHAKRRYADVVAAMPADDRAEITSLMGQFAPDGILRTTGGPIRIDRTTEETS